MTPNPSLERTSTGMAPRDNWPDDADGDVLRRMDEAGFDFSVPHEVEFNVDFANWPPSREAITWLQSKYTSVEVYEPDAQFGGYVLVKVVAPITYEFVVATQALVSEALAQEGAVCESWGVLH